MTINGFKAVSRLFGPCTLATKRQGLGRKVGRLRVAGGSERRELSLQGVSLAVHRARLTLFEQLPGLLE
jgi:hypothetical protein